MKISLIKDQTSILNKSIPNYYFLVLAPVMLSIYFNMLAPGAPIISQRLFASFIFVLGFIPAFIYAKRNEVGIPFLPLFGLIYSIYYAIPIFTLDKYTMGFKVIPPASLEKALLLSIMGFLALLLSYYALAGKAIYRYIPRVSIFWDPEKAKFWGIIMAVFGLGFSFLNLIIRVPLQFAQVFNFISQLSIVGMGILFILQLKGNLNLSVKLLLWGLFLPTYVLIVLGVGLLTDLFLFMFFLFFIYWHFRRRVPWKVIICSILMFSLLLSVKYEFRILTWVGYKKEASFIEKSLLFIKLGLEEGESYAKIYKTVVTRTGYNILTFGHVVDLTPKIIPYYMGKTYLALIWAPVPRVIFPWKPKMALSQEFGHRYNILDPSDHVTSYNLAQLIEMYVNFGVIGVIVGMFLMGIIYRFFYEMFCHSGAGEGGLLIGVFVFTKLANIESDFSMVFANIPYYIILLVILNRFMRKRAVKD